MPYLKSLDFSINKENRFPFNIPAINYAREINIENEINFFVGDNGTGKSTLVESIAFRLQLPHMDGTVHHAKSFKGARIIATRLDMSAYLYRFYYLYQSWCALLQSNLTQLSEDLLMK